MADSTIDSYGVQMNRAIRAVLQMHADSSKLLLDIDAQLKDFIPLYDGIVTANLSYDIKSRRYMAEGLFRHYVRAKTDTEVIAVNILYFDEGRKPSFHEPLFVAAKLNYLTVGTASDRSYRFWHPWAALVDWSGGMALKEVTQLTNVGKGGEVLNVAVKASPLFEIDTIERAMEILYLVSPDLRPLSR